MIAALGMADNEDDFYIRLLKTGDTKAFADFYDALWEPVFNYVMAILQDKDDAIDTVQDTFVSLWQQRERLSEVESIEYYVFSIAKYKALRHIRLNIRKRDYLASLRDVSTAYAESPDDCFSTAELKQLFDEEVDKLPARMKEVFRLSREENLSYKEIAERLHISDKTVKKQINKTLRILRIKLNGSLVVAAAFLQYL